MELVGFSGERQSGDAIYQLTNKLGDGTALSEYHPGESIYEDNNFYVEDNSEIFNKVLSSTSYWNATPVFIAPTIIEDSSGTNSDSYTTLETEQTDPQNIQIDEQSDSDWSDDELQDLGNLWGQISSPDTRPPDANLDRLLKESLASIGVTVSDVNNILLKSGSAIAVANVLEQSIEVAKGKANIQTLPEEAAHMFIAMLDRSNPLLQKMMKDITSFKVYEEVKAEYGEIYKDEEKIKLEAIGKLVGNIIVNNFSGESSANIEKAKGWWNRIWEVIKKILAKLNINTLKQYTSPEPSAYKQLASDIVHKKYNKSLSEVIVETNYNSIVLTLQEKKFLTKKCD